jgi:hypothetical protein
VDNYQKNLKSPTVLQYVRQGEFASVGSELQNQRFGSGLTNYYTKQIVLNYPLPFLESNPLGEHLMGRMREYLESHPGITSSEVGYPTVQGGCFGSLPLTDGRPSTFLDLLGKAVENAGGQIQDAIGNVGDAISAIETFVDLAGKINLKVPANLSVIADNAGPLGEVLDLLSIGGKAEEVGSRCLLALASGSEEAFVNAINDGARFAVSFITGKLGEAGGDILGAVAGTALAGPIGSILGGFAGGFLGGAFGEWVGEQAYDLLLKDWVTKHIAERLFDLLCPKKLASMPGAQPGVPGRAPPGLLLPPNTPRPGGGSGPVIIVSPNNPMQGGRSGAGGAGVK